MANVTRRYLYQGPPLQEIRDKTDPALTIMSAELKLAFDVTFDDESADIAAVDQAMAESGGFVPDPGADTTEPPSFPGGGASNALVFRPGSGLPGPIIFDAWADLMTELERLRSSANGGGSYTIEIDGSIVSPATLPVGTYDMTNVVLSGRSGLATALVIPEGVIFTKLRGLINNLHVEFTGDTPPVSDFDAAPFEGFGITNGAEIVCVGTGPFLRNSATLVVVALLTGGRIVSGSTPVIDVATAAPGTAVWIIGFDAAGLDSNTISGIAGAQASLTWKSSSATLSDIQPALTGSSGAVLSLQNDTFARRFPSAIITANQMIGPNEVARVDTTGGAITITLPSAVGTRGLMPIVKDVGGVASGTPITIAPSGSDTIDGGASATLAVDKGSIKFVSDGVSDWLIV